MKKASFVFLVLLSFVILLLLSQCETPPPPTFDSPVVSHWTTPVPELIIGDVITTSIRISWDEYIQVSGYLTDWAILVEFELRKGGGIVIERRPLVPDCKAGYEAGTGWCGEPVAAVWDTTNLSPGDYEVFVRLVWVNQFTGETIYGFLEGEGAQDDEHFSILEKFKLLGNIYLPRLMKRSS